MNEKIIGILGGMGPEATLDLFHKTIRLSPVEKDQDHLRIIIDNNPKIPDRTAAIFGKGENPLPALQETAKNLEKAGADFIIMPCNTAHYFISEIQQSIKIPILNMIKETAHHVKSIFPSTKNVGLLATKGTCGNPTDKPVAPFPLFELCSTPFGRILHSSTGKPVVFCPSG